MKLLKFYSHTALNLFHKHRRAGVLLMMRCIVTGLMVTMIAVTPANAELIPWKTVGVWSIDRETDEPSCSMSSVYEGDGNTFLLLSYTPAKDEAFLSISNLNWKSIKDAEAMVLDYHVGDETWSAVKTKGFNDGDKPDDRKGFFAYFDGKDFLVDFGLAPGLVIKKGDTVIDRLSLRGTKAAVLELARCANSQNKGLLKDPFAK